ncbi:uncharacterized protein METZ01_LOCUS489613, partial [marine metagenome]
MPYDNYNTQIFMENRMKPLQTLVALLTISLFALAACG